MQLFITAVFPFRRGGLEMKAGESAWLDRALACALASEGKVNIPRPQPPAPDQPVKPAASN